MNYRQLRNLNRYRRNFSRMIEKMQSVFVLDMLESGGCIERTHMEGTKGEWMDAIGYFLDLV